MKNKHYRFILLIASILSILGYSVLSAHYTYLSDYARTVFVSEYNIEPNKDTYTSGEFVNSELKIELPLGKNTIIPVKNRVIIFTPLEAPDSYMMINNAKKYPDSKGKIRNYILPYTVYEFEVPASKAQIFLSGKIPSYKTTIELHTVFVNTHSMFGKAEARLHSAYRDVIDLSNKSRFLKKADFYNKPIFKDNWFYVENIDNRTFRWMSQDAKIFVYSPLPNKALLNFSSLWAFNRPRTLQIFLNGILQGSYKIDNNPRVVGEVIELEAGKNVIEFHSVEGCERPYELGISYDNRCLSFAFFNVNITPLNFIQNTLLYKIQ